MPAKPRGPADGRRRDGKRLRGLPVLNERQEGRFPMQVYLRNREAPPTDAAETASVEGAYRFRVIATKTLPNASVPVKP